mmetsp:Transcript_18891/g.27399  ORF Transcript_18891/g.27399 Transcript_18891/m.27399 type:complete len:903 (+) Transcript_18891:110-2818(+)
MRDDDKSASKGETSPLLTCDNPNESYLTGAIADFDTPTTAETDTTLTATGTNEKERYGYVTFSDKHLCSPIALEKLKISKNMPSFRRRRSMISSHDIAPALALLPLITGGKLPESPYDGQNPISHPSTRIKFLPIKAPYRRRQRHRSFKLFWINEFRHWWKSSRLLVRLAGLECSAQTNWSVAVDTKISLISLNLHKRKGPKLGLKLVKYLGRGGVMSSFLKSVQPFTRCVRILVATWRWVEAAPCRRWQVGVEEMTAFVGNRCSRLFSRSLVDWFSLYCVFPLINICLQNDILWFQPQTYNPGVVVIILGVLRAIAPYGASFQGSRLGRVLTRGMFFNGMCRWPPNGRISELNLESEDCHEGDEVAEDATLLPLARDVAAALGSAGKDYKIQLNLKSVGFQQVGCGAGGYGVYELAKFCHGGVVQLHITPYGPSIMDIMPMYIILEREESTDLRSSWSKSIAAFQYIGPRVLEGFIYQGAFFSYHHFAELRERYDEVMLNYSLACKYMCKRRRQGFHDEFASPPTDLASLKRFLETGRRGRDQRKTNRRLAQIQRRVKHLARMIQTTMNDHKKKTNEAPLGVILYFEGLDCSGKSSTGNLIRDALLQAGYEVGIVQYNRPPTPEEKLHSWMDRFQSPIETRSNTKEVFDCEGQKTVKSTNSQMNTHKALIWDRGPAGDFVYGSLATASEETRQERYREFLEFDRSCQKNNIFFCKLLFLTDRDAISRTLGKRLAHRKICQDLHIWLDSSCGGTPHRREGLDEIDYHIDPTDFAAFNSYNRNLSKFVKFAKNTDILPPSDDDGGGVFQNPWVMVSTARRHPARLALIKTFEKQLRAFQMRKHHRFCKYPKNSTKKGTAFTEENNRDIYKFEGKWKRAIRTCLFFIGIAALYWYYLNTKTDFF